MSENERYADDAANSVTTGLIAVLGVHTRFLDDFLADAGRAGIRQVVLLASGLDTRPYRLWWPPGTTVYEVDQPAILEFKTGVLRDLGAELTANRRAVGVDLRHDWPAALSRVGFDAAQPTVWIAESLLVGYLTPDGQDRLLRDVTAASAPGSRLAADDISSPNPVQRRARGGFGGALPCLKQALTLFPADISMMMALARCQLGLDQPKDALATLGEALERAPTYANAHAIKGQVLWRLRVV